MKGLEGVHRKDFQHADSADQEVATRHTPPSPLWGLTPPKTPPWGARTPVRPRPPPRRQCGFYPFG